ncbi:MAG: glycine cleavage system aminomethyltransferase GcvT [archaeon]
MALRTPLFGEHSALGAQVIDFGGWDMPVYYTNILGEHYSTRSACGLFDICHMGEFFVEGKDAEALVQKVFSRDISNLAVGKMALGVLCNEQGGVIDDLTVYRLADRKFMLVVNSSTTKKDFEWVQKAKKKFGFEAKFENKSNSIGKLDIQGPCAQKILQKIVSFDLNELGFYAFREQKKSLNGIDSIISRSGYTGEDGFELYFGWGKSVEVWRRLLAAGKADGIVPVGLGARDTLRLEAGFNLYGNEMDEQVSPLECRYAWVVSLEKDFIGRDAIKKLRDSGVERALVGFEMVERGIARHGDKAFGFDGSPVGHVTSGSFSPTLKKNIGLCSIKKEFSGVGQEILVQVREKRLVAKIVKLPFYKRGERIE